MPTSLHAREIDGGGPRQPMLVLGQDHRFASGGRRYQFFFQKPLQRLVVQQRLDQQLLQPAVLGSSDFSRLASDTVIPRYLARHS